MSDVIDKDTLMMSALSQMSEGVIIAGKEGELLYFNDFAEKLHGAGLRNVSPEDYSKTYNLLRMSGTPFPFDELPLSRTVARGEVVENVRWRIVRPDGTEVVALGTSRPVFAQDGSQIGSVLTIRDDSDAFETRSKLENALRLQTTLLHELNHRVANNLSLLQSLLRFQAREAETDEAKQVLNRTQSRIQAIASVHEALYAADTQSNISIGPFIRDLAVNIRDALSTKVDVNLELSESDDFNLPINEAVPVALIIAELMTNSLKYAFEGERGEIAISLSKIDKTRSVEYRDDGIGLESADGQNRKAGLGSNIISSLVQQLGGVGAYHPTETGVCYQLSF